MVAGVPVLLAHLVDDAARAHLVGHPGDRAEEAGLLDLDLGHPVAPHGEVRRDGHLSTLPGRGVWHDRFMRIVSLLPSTTEILFDIGAGDDVVGVTFECDHPAEARERTIVSTSAMPEGLDAAGIDAFVTAAMRAGEDLYHLDEGALSGLDADLVVTQDLCAVCAVDVSVVDDALAHLGCTAEVLTIDPHTLDEVLDSVLTLGTATGHEAEARAAGALAAGPAGPGRRARWPARHRDRPRGCCCSSGPTRPSRRATGSRR